MILAEPTHEPKVRQGVTTEVIGVDGLSYAPFRTQRDLDDFILMNGGLGGRPDVEADWSDVPSFLARFDRHVSVNIALLIGNSALRIAVPELGWEDAPADMDAIDRMAGVLREAMEEGAFGLSSGLDYPPGSYATTTELASLAREAGRLGGFYHTHVRYALGDRFLDPFREAIEIGRRGEAPAHITHFYHRKTFPGTPEQMLDLVDKARDDGLDVTFDAYPYEWASTRLLILIPGWVQAGGPAKTKERLVETNVRDRIRRELAERGVLFAGAGGLRDIRIGYLTRPENLRWEGRTLGELFDATGSDPIAALCDLLLGPAHGRHPTLPPPPDRPGRDGLDLRRRQAEPAKLRQLPADPGPVRARRGAAQPRGRGLEDDRRSGRAAGTDGPGRDSRRRRGRPRRVRPGEGSGQRHLRRAPPVPRRHRARHRQREAGDRRWPAHGSVAGSGASPRTSRRLGGGLEPRPKRARPRAGRRRRRRPPRAGGGRR